MHWEVCCWNRSELHSLDVSGSPRPSSPSSLLVLQGRVEEAEYHFRRDMDRSVYGRCHPDNIWALCGLVGCLKRKVKMQQTEQPDSEPDPVLVEELACVCEKIEKLRSRCDVEVTVSCLCVKQSALTA
jgi:hypothetical protein